MIFRFQPLLLLSLILALPGTLLASSPKKATASQKDVKTKIEKTKNAAHSSPSALSHATAASHNPAYYSQRSYRPKPRTTPSTASATREISALDFYIPPMPSTTQPMAKPVSTPQHHVHATASHASSAAALQASLKKNNVPKVPSSLTKPSSHTATASHTLTASMPVKLAPASKQTSHSPIATAATAAASKQTAHKPGATAASSAVSKPAAKIAIPSVPKRACSICTDDKRLNEFPTLSCGHNTACKDCLSSLFAIALKDKKTDQLRCPDIKCKKEFTDNDVRVITKDRKQLAALNDILAAQYFAQNPLMKNCPTPNCTFIYELPGANPDWRETVNCPKCKKSFCSHCRLAHSKQISCKEAEENSSLGKDKSKDDKANKEYFERNTKPCPKCNKRIEKNEGCNHMTCTQCKHHFCWLCLGNYNIHAYPPHICTANHNPNAAARAPRVEHRNHHDHFEFPLVVTTMTDEFAPDIIDQIHRDLARAGFNPHRAVNVTITNNGYHAVQIDVGMRRELGNIHYEADEFAEFFARLGFFLNNLNGPHD